MKIVAYIMLLLAPAALSAQNGLHLVGHLDQKHGTTGGVSYNGSWGYVGPDGREYAILGTATGTAIIEITNTADIHEIVHIPGPTSLWREMRTYRNRLYVVTENGGGTQIIDLSALPDTATLIKSFTYVRGAQHTASSHTIEIFDGYMYLNGCSGWGTTPQRGVVIFSLADPDNPQYAGEYTPDYFHDSYVRHDTLFGASIYSSGGVYIADITNKSLPVPIGKIAYAGSGTHNVWTTKDGRYVISTDEIGSAVKSLKFWDLTNLPVIPTVPTSTYLFNGLGDIEHNVFVRGDYAYTAWYTAGTVVVDVTNPASPVTAGWYDSSDDLLYSPGQYDGVWAVYPYYWSGKVTAGDMQNGLYVFTFDSLKPRAPASLLAPANVAASCDDAPVTFRWTRVADPVKDPVGYELHVTGPGLDTLIQAGGDTSAVVNPASLGFGTFQWSVITKDEANAVASQDTFLFYHPSRAPSVVSPNGGEMLKANASIPITWSSACVDSVSIAYSTNGGASWLTVAPVLPALPASYAWTVPMTPSAHVLVRVRNAADTTLADASDAECTIFNSHSVALTAPNGGEVWQSGTEHAITWTSGLVTHVGIEYSTNSGANWLTVAADTPSVLGAVRWLVPQESVTTALVRVTDLDNPSVSDTSDATFTIWPIAADLSESWNLVSFPGIPADPLAAANYPGAASPLFRFAAGYAQADSVEQGAGYWVKYGAARSVALNGTPVVADTVAVAGRWNLIGSLSVPAAVSALIPVPGTMTLSTVYGYASDSGYYAADSLEPGKGYWVKASEGGQLILSPGAAARRVAFSEPPGDAVVFQSAAGDVRTLYVGRLGEELPPPPPGGSFDVRFASQRLSEAVTPEGAVIIIRAGVYPLKVIFSPTSGSRYRIVERVRGMERASYALSAGETVIPAAPAGSLTIEPAAAGAQPDNFVLRQNWPNPFNPVTTIGFTLREAAHVSLTVYSLLGSEVATLVDGVMTAGDHRVDFDAKSLPSGVYLCRLRTAGGTEMRKMVLAR
jgi:choice-of-anchor B domain-containing protein